MQILSAAFLDTAFNVIQQRRGAIAGDIGGARVRSQFVDGAFRLAQRAFDFLRDGLDVSGVGHADGNLLVVDRCAAIAVALLDLLQRHGCRLQLGLCICGNLKFDIRCNVGGRAAGNLQAGQTFVEIHHGAANGLNPFQRFGIVRAAVVLQKTDVKRRADDGPDHHDGQENAEHTAHFR